MKRGRVLDISDCCVHVTHRCHDRQFLFRFAVDRRNYARRLRDTATRFDVSVLDYIVTSNHVHLLLKADRVEYISAAMQYLQGLTGRDFNRRKQRSGAYWSDRFSPTLIENGCHLSRCLFYIGLNMVRTRAVNHPGEWDAAGYHELTGRRQRYRIIDLPVLLDCLEMPGRTDGFRDWYERTMQEMLSGGYLCREPQWSEATAVGSRAWVESLAEHVVVGPRSIEAVPPSPSHVGEEEASYALRLSARQSDLLWQT